MYSDFRSLFQHSWPLIGVVHLPALPGSPSHQLSFAEIEEKATADTEALVKAGFEGIVVENFGDAPFIPEEVGPHTVSAMTLLTDRVQRLTWRLAPLSPPTVGINVLRNDARAAIAIAAITHASFIRVNVHVGAMVTDQGILQGRAHETLRYRRSLGASVAILADVFVKHAYPLGPVELEAVAKDTLLRGGADALIVSGSATGEPADLTQALRIRKALPNATILLGSGLSLETLENSIYAANGAIVGTALKYGGRVDAAIDPARAAEFVEARNGFLLENQCSSSSRDGR